MEICYSTDVEAFYVTLGQGLVAMTAHISDDAWWTSSPTGWCME